MSGYLLLEGGAEFGGGMVIPDRRAVTLAGGLQVPVAIIPTAAAPDHNHLHAGNNGVRWFQALGAQQVKLVMLIDRASAEAEEIADTLRASRLIYLLGGFPRYLAETLAGSRAWEAVLAAYQSGAVIAGSSAGAMVVCQVYYDPDSQQVLPGLDLIHKACVLPHHNSFGKKWAGQLSRLLPGVTLIGIDEQTGLLDDAPGGTWNVYGKGAVTLYHQGNPYTHLPGTPFSLA